MGILVAMERKALLFPAVGTALALGLVMSGPAMAQDTASRTPARTTTQSLNTGPADSSLGSRPPGAPLPQVRPAPVPVPVRPAPAALRDPVAELLGLIEAGNQPATAASTPDGDARVAEVPAGPASALPPLPVGYYVRGDKDCNRIWPLAGDLAWLSARSFSIDFGGCEPGEIARTGTTTWRERQTCQTELGSDGPPYVIDYEVGLDGALLTRARLGEADPGVQDRWQACDAADVPAEARFHADDPGRFIPDLERDPDQDT